MYTGREDERIRGENDERVRGEKHKREIQRQRRELEERHRPHSRIQIDIQAARQTGGKRGTFILEVQIDALS